ncbi:hypothetical protein F8388_025609 [Cannabis sativa]|uniref:Uncharacterized protein n=1 Tax=Cannabis sativa TaxID=3483 RepID=A0A7J6G1B4_CANSA|nr:hypothetical protein F8388_025609 [Cannabis sativa]
MGVIDSHIYFFYLRRRRSPIGSSGQRTSPPFLLYLRFRTHNEILVKKFKANFFVESISPYCEK